MINKLLVINILSLKMYKCGYNALITAAMHNQLDVVELLLNKKYHANVNTTDNEGRTALTWSAAKGHLRVARSLLSHGADVNSADNDGEMAIHTAAQFQQYDMVELLLLYGAETALTCRQGNTLQTMAQADNKLAEILQRHEAAAATAPSS